MTIFILLFKNLHKPLMQIMLPLQSFPFGFVLNIFKICG